MSVNFLLLLLILFQSTLYAQTIKDTVVTLETNEAPPFWSKQLPDDGMAGEIVHAISKAAGINSKIVYKPLSRIIKDDTNNDLGNPAFFIVNQDFAHIIPIALYHASFYYYAPNHKEKLEFKSLNDLQGMKIGILKGTLIERHYFEKNNIYFQESYTQESLFKKLKLGRLDMVIEIELVAEEIINNLFVKELDNFVAIPILDSSQPIAIMLSQEEPNAKSLNQAYINGLKKIINNGIYQEILEKHYTNSDIPNKWFKELKHFEQLYKIEEEY